MSGNISSAVLAQVHLSGESDCCTFSPNRFKPNFCTNCSHDLASHKVESIADDKTILEAIEYSQSGEKVPSCVLPADGGLGGLYLGGYKAVMNAAFLKEHRVGHVVNTARGLEVFGPKYTEAVKKARAEGVDFLEMGWTDDVSFVIPLRDLVRSVEYVHRARAASRSVLVHCAQGKSRSSTVVIAYVMATLDQPVMKAWDLVREQRKMAAPNAAFLETLKTFQSSDDLAALKKRLAVAL